MITLAKYDKLRDRIFPLIQQSAKKNRHDFADNVDKSLLSNRAFLFIAPDGFFVLEPSSSGVVGVIFAFSFGGNNCVKYQPAIEQLARDIGAKQLYFLTSLRGFSILAKKLGYTKDSQSGRVTKWIKEVPYGR
ncbi:hypothetical protein DI392_00695 [Vibrio albus]|uniref:Uncharacterized protein n=1 Tax=Vibrio albus TaxID=2200953 RepID=A0A2U3BDL3_9VIBR|nr:hypothetical protein [Vibrio albus]PWI34832.1 hypothetical protein DI392_00695 [Vibrio albus]